MKHKTTLPDCHVQKETFYYFAITIFIKLVRFEWAMGQDADRRMLFVYRLARTPFPDSSKILCEVKASNAPISDKAAN